MDEVEEDQESNADGRKFEKEFQQVAVAHCRQGNRKRKVPVQEVRVKTRNDLDSDSNNEGSIGTGCLVGPLIARLLNMFKLIVK
jgi:hypothetical protein